MDEGPGQRAFLCHRSDLARTVHIGLYWLVTMSVGGFWEDRSSGDEMGSRSRKQTDALNG
jgi:hypothetical protein